MTIAASVKRFISDKGIAYQIVQHERTSTLEEAALAAGVNKDKLLRSVLLSDAQGVVLAILPATYKLDLTRIRRLLKRKLTLISGKKVDKLFSDCEPGSHPPVGEAYGMQCIIDDSLRHTDDVYFEPGTHHALVHMKCDDFYYLLFNAQKGIFALPADISSVAITVSAEKNRFSVDSLNTATLKKLEHATAGLCQSPLVCLLSQLLEHLQSGIYNDAWYNKIKCVGALEKIIVLLGNIWTKKEAHSLDDIDNTLMTPEMVNSLAINLLTLLVFKAHTKGPFGEDKVLAHALLSGILTGLLVQRLSRRIIGSNVHLLSASMLQNTGILLLGHLFPPEFRLLNCLGAAAPKSTLEVIEQRVLGMGQAHEIMLIGYRQLGAWILSHWNFPSVVVDVVGQLSDNISANTKPSYHDVIALINSLVYNYGVSQPLSNQSLADTLKLSGKLSINEKLLDECYACLCNNTRALDEILGCMPQMKKEIDSAVGPISHQVSVLPVSDEF